MILLDTNVLSELMRTSPELKVLQWLDLQRDTDIWISAITVAEIQLGIELLPEGKRRTLISKLAEQMFREDFSNRCLPFDFAAAKKYASIVSSRRLQGKPINVEDAQIAAIAQSSGLTVATRNTKDFFGIEDLNLINPWII